MIRLLSLSKQLHCYCINEFSAGIRIECQRYSEKLLIDYLLYNTFSSAANKLQGGDEDC